MTDFAQNKFDRKSFSGLMVLLANCAIIWSCRKQTSVCMSTVAAEYTAMSSAVPEVLWVTNLTTEMGFSHLAPKPAILRVDNNGAICVAQNQSTSKRSKSIDVKHHYLRDEYQQGNITFEHTSSANNLHC